MTELSDLARAARPINDEDWGSERQVAAENELYANAKNVISTQAWERFEDWGLKATTEERIAEALRLAASDPAAGGSARPEWPIYNYVAEISSGYVRAEIQSNSGAGERKHFKTIEGARVWARKRASEMLPRENWEPVIHRNNSK